MLQIHERIKLEREKKGLSQEEIAALIGIKRTTYAYWEEVTPKNEKIKLVAKALELPENYFFVNVEYENDPPVYDTKEGVLRMLDKALNANERHAASNEKNADNLAKLVEMLSVKINLTGTAEVSQSSPGKNAPQGVPPVQTVKILDIKENDSTVKIVNRKGRSAGKNKLRN